MLLMNLLLLLVCQCVINQTRLTGNCTRPKAGFTCIYYPCLFKEISQSEDKKTPPNINYQPVTLQVDQLQSLSHH